MQNHLISKVDVHKHLGLYCTNDCTWQNHINYIKEKAWHRLNIMRKLKFKLDRRSLETIYLTLIRPLFEYGDVIFDNCTQYEKQELDKIQNEAARIATGTTKLVSPATLYNEICWETLELRRYNHKLTLFYEMMRNITPLYLSSLVPQSVRNLSRYNRRNSNYLQTIDARTNQYYNSFLSSSVRSWNNLSVEAKQCDSVNSFKCLLQKEKKAVSKHYYIGCRKGQIQLTRLRTKCSSLKFDLFVKNISDSPLCLCGSIENTQHFFFHCTIYQAERNELINAISPYQYPSLNLFLYGDLSMPHGVNSMIFEKVYNISSKLF